MAFEQEPPESYGIVYCGDHPFTWMNEIVHVTQVHPLDGFWVRLALSDGAASAGDRRRNGIGLCTYRR